MQIPITMKKSISILLALVCLSASAFSQTQQGYIKTKGRSSNGKIIEGQRLAGATIQIKDRTAVLSNANGAFSFPTPDKQYALQQVQKQGYVLMDPDILSRTYTYSKNPLVIVLEDADQRRSDQRELSRTLRSSTYAELEQRKKEIEELKEQNRITEERYQELKSKWENDYDGNEDLIKDLVERFIKIDFDELDEFDRKFNNYLLAGQIRQADSMLHALGNVDEEISQLSQVHEQNAKTRAALEKREAAEAQKRQQLADRLYKHFLTKHAVHQNDSALLYLIKRINLDTTNADWLIDAGDFACNNLAYYDSAMHLYMRALRHSAPQTYFWNMASNNLGYVYDLLGNFEKAEQYYKLGYNGWKQLGGEEHPEVATCLLNIGGLDVSRGDFTSAQEKMQKALDIYIKTLGANSEKAAFAYNNLAYINFYLGNYDYALLTFRKALSILESVNGELNYSVASTFNNIGNLHENLGNFDSASAYYQRSLNIFQTIYGKNHPNIGGSYNNIGSLYRRTGKPREALEYHRKALKIYNEIYGTEHPEIATCYHNMGSDFKGLAVYDSSLFYATKALQIDLKYYGEVHSKTASSYGNIGTLYTNMGEYRKALSYLLRENAILLQTTGESSYEISGNYNNISNVYLYLEEYDSALVYTNKALAIWSQLLGEDHPNIAVALNNLAEIHNAKGNYTKALEELQKALTIEISTYGEQHPNVAGTYHNLGCTYRNLGQTDKAMEYLQKALAIKKQVNGEDHPTTKETQAAIDTLTKK